MARVHASARSDCPAATCAAGWWCWSRPGVWHFGPTAVAPSPLPPPAETSTTATRWTPERIREEGAPGDPQGAIPITDSGLATRLYQVCDGTRCSIEDGPPEDLHVAVEVTRGGRSADFDLHHSTQPWVRAFDADSVLVQDAEPGQPDAPVRYRLLQADGTAVQLRVSDEPAADALAGTIQPVDTPAEVRYWGPNASEFLWGVSDDCRVFWAVEGEFEEHRLECAPTVDFTSGISADQFPPGWLQPGRMAVVDQGDGQLEDQTAVHVSLDYGLTWRRLPVAADASTADVLGRVG